MLTRKCLVANWSLLATTVPYLTLEMSSCMNLKNYYEVFDYVCKLCKAQIQVCWPSDLEILFFYYRKRLIKNGVSIVF